MIKIHQMTEKLSSTFYVEVHVFLIFDKESRKYNLYVVGYEDVEFPIRASFIVENFSKRTIEEAIACFPSYNFTDKNYGF